MVGDLKDENEEVEVLSATDYYPFGMIAKAYNSQNYRYGYNGKERDAEGTGGGGSTYDYGFRIYNPNIAKFLSVDPLHQSYPWNSTYAFAENDVIRSIDLDGLEKLALSGSVPPEQYYKKSREGLPGNTSYEASHVYGFAKQTERLKLKYGFHAKKVQSGAEVLSALEKETTLHGSITHLFFFGHGNNNGWLLKSNEGFYKNDRMNYGGSDDLTELQKKIESGAIKFSPKAVIFIDACNNGGLWGDDIEQSFAYQLTLTTGATVIASDAHVRMDDFTTPGDSKYNGKFRVAEPEGNFYKFTRIETIVTQQKVDESGNLVTDDEGNPVMEDVKVFSVKYEKIGQTAQTDDFVK